MAKLRFREIDDSNRHDHYYLTAEDNCLFLFEYTSGRDYKFSDTNDLISNLKKKPSLRYTQAYRHKLKAIDKCAAYFEAAINIDALKEYTLVPIPPSKARDHADYDDRMLQVCRQIAPESGLDIRELVVVTRSHEAFHEGQRMKPEELIKCLAIDETLTEPAPKSIVIVDDVVTNGTHFRAMKMLLHSKFPQSEIFGLFVARRVFPPDQDASELFDVLG